MTRTKDLLLFSWCFSLQTLIPSSLKKMFVEKYMYESNKIDHKIKLHKHTDWFPDESLDNESYNKALKGDYAKFMHRITEKDNVPRFLKLMAMKGYETHDYYGQKRKAIFYTDSSLNSEGEANGRTGKTVSIKANGYVRKLTEINGKGFKPDYQHRYSSVDIDTQMVALNDLAYTFDLEKLYPDITEGIPVSPRGLAEYTQHAKMIFSSNRPIELEGDSSKDRVIEFEVSPYFSKRYQPSDEFGKWFFSEDWEHKDWNDFYNFYIMCAYMYHKNGLKEVNAINSELNKIINYCESECYFIDWYESVIDNAVHLQRTDRKTLFSQYLNGCEHFGLTMSTFMKLIKLYHDYTPRLVNWDQHKHLKASGGKRYIIFDFDASYKPKK